MSPRRGTNASPIRLTVCLKSMCRTSLASTSRSFRSTGPMQVIAAFKSIGSPSEHIRCISPTRVTKTLSHASIICSAWLFHDSLKANIQMLPRSATDVARNVSSSSVSAVLAKTRTKSEMWCWTTDSMSFAANIFAIAKASPPLRIDATAGAYPSIERHSLHTNAAFLKSLGEHDDFMASPRSVIMSFPAYSISQAEPERYAGEDIHLEGTSASSGIVFKVANKWLRRLDLLMW